MDKQRINDARRACYNLRDAIESGESWRVICRASENLDDILYQAADDFSLTVLYAQLFDELERKKPTDWDRVDSALRIIEQHLESLSPDLSARIEAAAKEIANIDWVSGDMVQVLTAIIKRHIEGGK